MTFYIIEKEKTTNIAIFEKIHEQIWACLNETKMSRHPRETMIHSDCYTTHKKGYWTFGRNLCKRK